MTAAGLIFSNIHDGELSALTEGRTMASVPFGCRYRLIDFALSNMVNAGITNIGMIARSNYRSLLEHIGMGSDWDLARRSGGIKIIAPNVSGTDIENDRSGARLGALCGALGFIRSAKEEYFVLSDPDVIANIDLSDMIRYHIERGADVTFALKRLDAGRERLSRRVKVVRTDAEGNVLGISPYARQTGEVTVSTNVVVIKKELLHSLVKEGEERGSLDFYRDLIEGGFGRLRVVAYEYTGYYSLISDLVGYFECNMKLLDRRARRALFGVEARPIYTKVKNSPPTRYEKGARVENSLIADGCIIKGRVENSIIFRGVQVGEGSEVRNCILLPDTTVGERVSLNCVVTDKNVEIKDERVLSGHPSMCFFVNKGMSV